MNSGCIFRNRCGTSWDPNIRFANEKQSDLWRKNVETLVSEGITIKLFIEKIEIYLDDLDMPWPTGKKPMHK